MAAYEDDRFLSVDSHRFGCCFFFDVAIVQTLIIYGGNFN